MIKKASIYTMNALNKLSELWHTSVNRQDRPVVEGEHDKSWNDHGTNYNLILSKGAREVAEADWRWDSGASWDYTDWSLAEPNDGVNQNCLIMSSHHGYKWVDELCGGNPNYPARPACQMY